MVQITIPLEKDLRHGQTVVRYLGRAKFLVGVQRWLNGKAGWFSKRRRTRETHRNDLEKARIWGRLVHRPMATVTEPQSIDQVWAVVMDRNRSRSHDRLTGNMTQCSIINFAHFSPITAAFEAMT